MTPQWVLLARLDGLIARLGQAQQAIATEGQNTRLCKRIREDLTGRLSEHTAALKLSRKKVAAAAQVLQHAWSDTKSSASVRLLDECLLYLQAARSRGSDVEADLCEISDALFEELGAKARSVSWKSFSVFAAEDSFDVLTRIIRVRYPVSGVWDIPVGVHEFGHFLSGHLRQQSEDGTATLAFEDYKRTFAPPKALTEDQTLGPGIEWSSWLDEIFADVFGAYAAGPAFAFSCLLFRFDPSSADEESDGKHPSYAKRAYVILQTLRRCNNEPPCKGKFGPAIKLLQESWEAACQAAGISPEISERLKNWIDGQASTFYYWLKTSEGGLLFSGWQGAEDKMSWLGSPPDSPGEFTIAELLNTAWMCRLKENSNPDKLSKNFIKLARKKTENHDR